MRHVFFHVLDDVSLVLLLVIACGRSIVLPDLHNGSLVLHIDYIISWLNMYD